MVSLREWRDRPRLWVGAAAIAAVVVALIVAFWPSGGSSTQDASESTETSVAPSTTLVYIDPEVLDQLNTEPGEVIEPGSIKSTKQDLSEECAKFVQPLRDLMVEFPSVRQVPLDGTYERAFKEGKRCESEVSMQEWTDFYTLELAGWLYAKTD